jgi:signal-transduction protein with cAMP-binding, CBS, and nucleotidyltransferase domain
VETDFFGPGDVDPPRSRGGGADPGITRDAAALQSRIRQESYDDLLGGIGKAIDRLLGRMMDAGVPLEETLTTIADLHDALTCRILDHARQQLPPAPVPACWICLGSDARREQLIRTDQDHALIYDEAPAGSRRLVDDTYRRLAEKAVAELDRCGFARCIGGVMASNAEWRMSLSRWQASLDDWVRSVDPADIRRLTILLDFRPLWGERRLAERLREAVFTAFEASAYVNHRLTRDDNLFAAPFTWTGRIRTLSTDDGRRCFHIKSFGMVHLINGIRLLALNHRITAPSTLGRLQALTEMGVVTEERSRRYRHAFTYLMRLRVASGLRAHRANEKADHCCDLSTMAPAERLELKKVLTDITQLQKRIHREYNMAWANYFN